jgi:hypothetical protein
MFAFHGTSGCLVNGTVGDAVVMVKETAAKINDMVATSVDWRNQIVKSFLTKDCHTAIADFETDAVMVVNYLEHECTKADDFGNDIFSVAAASKDTLANTTKEFNKLRKHATRYFGVAAQQEGVYEYMQPSPYVPDDLEDLLFNVNVKGKTNKKARKGDTIAVSDSEE